MAMKDCIEHLYSWDYTIQDAYGCPGCVERERIIKLLKETMCSSKFDSPDNGDCMGYCWNCMFKDEIIALIKGENK